MPSSGFWYEIMKKYEAAGIPWRVVLARPREQHGSHTGKFWCLAPSVPTVAALQRRSMKGGTANVVFILYKCEVSWDLKHNRDRVCEYI